MTAWLITGAAALLPLLIALSWVRIGRSDRKGASRPRR